jgi:hypothetical protein
MEQGARRGVVQFGQRTPHILKTENPDSPSSFLFLQEKQRITPTGVKTLIFLKYNMHKSAVARQGEAVLSSIKVSVDGHGIVHVVNCK